MSRSEVQMRFIGMYFVCPSVCPYPQMDPCWLLCIYENAINTHYYFSNLIRWVGSRRVGAPGTTGSHETKSSVIRSFLAHPRDVILPSDQVTKVMMYLLYTYKNNKNKARTT